MSDISRASEWWLNLTLVLAVLFAITLLAWFFDGRLIDRESVWAKPLKFEASLALHFATLVFALGLLDPTSAWGRIVLVAAIASIASTVFEMGYIIIQAARQQPSHFNLSDSFYTAMYVLMAIGAVFITVAAGVVGAAVLTDARPGVSAALRWSLALGLIGGTVLTLVTAFRMGGALNHHNGLELAQSTRMPLTGWSLSVGDRRVPHFLATHMMQALPVAGYALSALLSPALAVAGVFVVAALWTAITLIAFAQANAGLPLTQWPFN